MTQVEFDKLERGDIVQGALSGDGYEIVLVVRDAQGKRTGEYIVAKTLTISNPAEWTLIYPYVWTGEAPRD